MVGVFLKKPLSNFLTLKNMCHLRQLLIYFRFFQTNDSFVQQINGGNLSSICRYSNVRVSYLNHLTRASTYFQILFNKTF